MSHRTVRPWIAWLAITTMVATTIAAWSWSKGPRRVDTVGATENQLKYLYDRIEMTSVEFPEPQLWTNGIERVVERIARSRPRFSRDLRSWVDGRTPVRLHPDAALWAQALHAGKPIEEVAAYVPLWITNSSGVAYALGINFDREIKELDSLPSW